MFEIHRLKMQNMQEMKLNIKDKTYSCLKPWLKKDEYKFFKDDEGAIRVGFKRRWELDCISVLLEKKDNLYYCCSILNFTYKFCPD